MKEIIIAVIGSGALSAVISAIIAAITARKKDKTGVRSGVRILLYDRIKHLGNSYIDRGSIRAEELEDIISMHSIYHTDLGGNGYLDTLMKSVKMLQIKN